MTSPRREPASRVDPHFLAKIARPVSSTEQLIACGVPSCPHPHRTTNLCIGHYMQLYKWRHAQGMPRIRHDRSKVTRIANLYRGKLPADERYCHMPHCDRPYRVRGLCHTHYNQHLRASKSS